MGRRPHAVIFFGIPITDPPEWAESFDLPEELLGLNVQLIWSGYEGGDKAIAITQSITSSDWDSNPLSLSNAPIRNTSNVMQGGWEKLLRNIAIEHLGEDIAPDWLIFVGES